MEKFADVLQGVLDKLGIGAAYLWPKAVLYTVVTGIADIVGGVAICILLLSMAKRLHARATVRETECGCDEDVTGMVRILAWALSFAGPIILILAVSCTTPQLIVPEYAAVRDLISAGAPKK